MITVKIPNGPVWLLILVACAVNVSAQITLRGVFNYDGTTYLSLQDELTPATWKKVGDHFAGYKIVNYESTSEVATLLASDGTEKSVRLEAAQPRARDDDRELVLRAQQELHRHRGWFPSEQFWRAADATERASFVQAFSIVGWNLFVDDSQSPMVVLLTSNKYLDSSGRAVILAWKGEHSR